MAELIWYSFTHDSKYEVVAFCNDDYDTPIYRNTLFNLPIVSFDDIVKRYPSNEYKFHIGIGRNSAREYIYNKVAEAGYTFASYISSRSNVWPDLVHGKNVFVDQGCCIHPFVTIGNNNILIGAGIGHHCVIQNNVLISCSILAGNVTISNNTFLGINSSVRENVIVGRNNIIGSGVFRQGHYGLRYVF